MKKRSQAMYKPPTLSHETKPSCSQNGKYLRKSQHLFPCQTNAHRQTHVRTLLVNLTQKEENSTTCAFNNANYSPNKF